MARIGHKTRKSTGAGWRRGVLIAAALGLGPLMTGCSSSDPNAKLSDEEGAALLTRVREHPPKPDDLTLGEKKWLKNYLAGQRGR
jgi:hypothetical protein